MNLKLDADNPADRENCAERFSILPPGEKCQSKKALLSVVDCYFHRRMNLPGSVAGEMASQVEVRGRRLRINLSKNRFRDRSGATKLQLGHSRALVLR
jgi:hypothetical protein